MRIAGHVDPLPGVGISFRKMTAAFDRLCKHPFPRGVFSFKMVNTPSGWTIGFFLTPKASPPILPPNNGLFSLHYHLAETGFLPEPIKGVERSRAQVSTEIFFTPA